MLQRSTRQLARFCKYARPVMSNAGLHPWLHYLRACNQSSAYCGLVQSYRGGERVGAVREERGQESSHLLASLTALDCV